MSDTNVATLKMYAADMKRRWRDAVMHNLDLNEWQCEAMAEVAEVRAENARLRAVVDLIALEPLCPICKTWAREGAYFNAVTPPVLRMLMERCLETLSGEAA